MIVPPTNVRVLIKLVMDALQRLIVAPQIEVMPHRASRRKILRQRPPLETGGEHVHDGVHDLVDFTFAAAALGGRNLRLDQLPFLIGHIAWVTNGCGRKACGFPASTSAAPPELWPASLELQPIPMT